MGDRLGRRQLLQDVFTSLKVVQIGRVPIDVLLQVDILSFLCVVSLASSWRLEFPCWLGSLLCWHYRGGNVR